MRCKSCGREIESNSMFCNWCGEKQIKERKKKDEIKIPSPRKLASGSYRIYLDAEKQSITEPTKALCVARAKAIRAGFIEQKKHAPRMTVGDAIDKMIYQIGHTDYAVLSEAIMPYPDGGIKDCIRVYKTQAGDISIKISNDDWKLIERKDTCEILYAYDIDTNSNVAKALLVKSFPELPGDDEELVGIIFPVNDEV